MEQLAEKHIRPMADGASLIVQVNLTAGSYHGKLCYNDDNSIVFRCVQSVKPGTIVYLQRCSCPDNPSKAAFCEYCPQAAFAVVKNCRRLDDDKKHPHLIAAKYFEYGIGY